MHLGYLILAGPLYLASSISSNVRHPKMRFYCWLFKENPLILGKKKEAEYTAHERSIVDRQGQLYGWVGAVVAWAGAVLTLGGGNNDHNTLFQSILRHPNSTLLI